MQSKKTNNVTRKMTTKTLVSCALLAALNVVLARFVGLMPNPSTRFSVEAVPVFLAGMLFGPLAGGLVGITADFTGCLFSPYGYNPFLSVPPILYGVFGGVFHRYLSKNVSIPRLVVSFLPPVYLGSVLYQSIALAALFFKGPFQEGVMFYLSTRSVQFTIAMVLDVMIIHLLFRFKLFERLGLWPARLDIKNKQEGI